MVKIMSTPMSQALGTTPIDPSASAAGVYFGQRLSYTPGAPGTSAAATVTANDYFVDRQKAWGWYGSLDSNGQEAMRQILRAKYPNLPINNSYIKNTATEGILFSNFAASQGERLDPLAALWRAYVDKDTSFFSGVMQGGGGGAGGGGGGGGGGGYSGPTASYSLTNPQTAQALVDQALEKYLGRSANAKERARFTAALNQAEMANPTITTPGVGTTVTQGGFSPTAFAESWAQSQEGAGEYQAATTLLDTFISSLKNPVKVT